MGSGGLSGTLRRSLGGCEALGDFPFYAQHKDVSKDYEDNNGHVVVAVEPGMGALHEGRGKYVCRKEKERKTDKITTKIGGCKKKRRGRKKYTHRKGVLLVFKRKTDHGHDQVTRLNDYRGIFPPR